MKKRLLKRIVLILIVVITAICIAMKYINAEDISANLLDGYAELTKQPNVGKYIYTSHEPHVNYNGKHSVGINNFSDATYCAQHKAALLDGEVYKVYRYVKIVGNKAVGINESGEMGSVTSRANLVMAYILGSEEMNTVDNVILRKGNGGYNTKTKKITWNTIRQRAFWRFSKDTWMDSVGSKFGVNWKYTSGTIDMTGSVEGTTGNKFLSNANRYADNTNITYADIKNVGSKTITTTDGNIGPIQVEFSGKVSSIIVTDIKGATIGSGIEFYSDLNYKNKITDISKIASKSKIYIKNSSGKIVKNVKIVVTGSDVIQAELWFIKRADDEKSQNLCTTKTSKVKDTAEVSIPVNTPTGKLIVKKVDTDDNNQKLTGAGYKLWRQDGWLQISGNGYAYTTDQTKASIFRAGDNDTITISNLPYGVYYLSEVEAPAGYVLKEQVGYNSGDNRVALGKIEINKGTTEKTVTNKLNSGEITLNKVDESDNTKKLKAGFKIHVTTTKEEGWLSGTNGSYTYKENESDADTYYTDESSGQLKLTGLILGHYIIYETEAPEGYNLSKQPGYEDEKVKIREVDLTSSNAKVELTINNSKIISISGYVWVEGIPDKGNEKDYDNIYTNDIDTKVKKDEVIVKLMKKGETTPVATTSVDENGEYLFDGLVKKHEIDNYYVEFDYSEKYKDYIPVEFNKAKENGSKALMNIVAEEDKNLTGIATTYSGTDASNISRYGIDAVGNYIDKDENGKQVDEYQNINLGIKKIIKPEFTVRENIVNVKLKIKGYTYTYIYGGNEKEDKFEGPLLNWQSSTNKYAYSKPIYPSDVIYDKQSSKQELEVLVTYRIDVTNDTNYNLTELYVENNLIIENVVDEFDNKRYVLSDSNWSVNPNSNIATMKKEYMDSIFKEGIKGKESKTAYIQFSASRDAVDKILENPNGLIEDNPTKVLVTGYHNYKRDDYMWSNLTKTEEGIEGVRSTGNSHKTDSQLKESEAPYLIFKLTDGLKQRTVSGTVFKDGIKTDNGEVLGDGIYNNGEKGVEGVKVELLDIGGEKLTLSHLYQAQQSGNTVRTNIVDAVVTTNDKGEYSLEGVVPGRYYLRFTYGNGTYKITKLNGETIQDGRLETKTDGTEISAKDYKSTIITSNIVKTALDFVEAVTSSMTNEQRQAYEQQLIEKTYTWYKEDTFTKNNYSVAVDDLDLRKQISESTENMNMSAQSPQFSITIENTIKNEAEEKIDTKDQSTTATNNTGTNIINKVLNNANETTKYQFKGLNFGIIEMPKQSAEIEKLITNVKLTNAQGNVLYNANPENISTQGAGIVTVTDLDNKKNEGSSYVRAEMVEESLYGSNLELTYEVRITNTSDINYYDKGYYIYGQRKDNKEVTLTPKTVKDYLDETLRYEAEKSEKDRIEEIDPNKAETITVDGKAIKAQEFNLNGWSTLYTNKIANRAQDHPSTDKVTLVASRTLSREDDDMEITSRAEIKEIIHTPDPKDEDSDTNKAEQLRIAAKEVHTNGMEKATFTITPPTGENRDNIALYSIVGIVSLLLLSTGIIVIKKKIQ